MVDQLRISWHDSAWIPHLNPKNILEYFCQKSNPFYDKNCNNEIARMQRLMPEQMLMMTGLEYILLHVQEPILYVIRKQERIGTDSVNPLIDYYILAGVVYQAPDAYSIVQSRLLNSALNLTNAMIEFQSIVTHSPSSGYKWKHVQELEESKSKERQQPASELTRFQTKINSLLANFSENN